MKGIGKGDIATGAMDSQYRPNCHFKIPSPAEVLKPYANSELPRNQKFPPNYRDFLIFCAFVDFCAGIPLPRLVIDTAPDFATGFTPKSQISPGGELRMGAF